MYRNLMVRFFDRFGKEQEPDIEKLTAKKDVKGLINALNRENIFWYTRRDIVRALGNIGGPEVVNHLAHSLKDEAYDVQLEAALALDRRFYQPKNDVEKAYLLLSQKKYDKLAELGAPAVEALTHELERFGGFQPANALIRIGEPAVEPLIGILGAPAAWARYQAARVLGEIGDARAIEHLTRLLDKEKNKEVLDVAANEIAKIKTKSNAP